MDETHPKRMIIYSIRGVGVFGGGGGNKIFVAEAIKKGPYYSSPKSIQVTFRFQVNFFPSPGPYLDLQLIQFSFSKKLKIFFMITKVDPH